MMDMLKQAYQVAQISGRSDIMIRCQAIANIAEKLDNLYKASPSKKSDKKELTELQIQNRQRINLHNVEDYMLKCVKEGIDLLGFEGEEFEKFFFNYLEYVKSVRKLEADGL